MLVTGGGFKEEPFSTAAQRGALKKYLAPAGLPDLNIHGARRGKMQHEYYRLKTPLEVVMRKSQMKTQSVAMRYLDQQAHRSLDL